MTALHHHPHKHGPGVRVKTSSIATSEQPDPQMQDCIRRYALLDKIHALRAQGKEYTRQAEYAMSLAHAAQHKWMLANKKTKTKATTATVKAVLLEQQAHEWQVQAARFESAADNFSVLAKQCQQRERATRQEWGKLVLAAANHHKCDDGSEDETVRTGASSRRLVRPVHPSGMMAVNKDKVSPRECASVAHGSPF